MRRSTGLVIGWMPNSQRCSTLAERLGYEAALLGRAGFRRWWTAAIAYPYWPEVGLADPSPAAAGDRRRRAAVRRTPGGGPVARLRGARSQSTSIRAPSWIDVGDGRFRCSRPCVGLRVPAS